MTEADRRIEARRGGQALTWLLALVLGGLVHLWGAVPVLAALPPGNAITDPAALLRDALPVDQPQLQDLQHRLENSSNDLRAKRWSALASTVRRTQSQFSGQRGRSWPASPRPIGTPLRA